MNSLLPLSVTLAVHPSDKGFGWAAFTSPLAPHDWGVVHTRGRGKNEQCLQRIDRLMRKFAPERLVIEAFEREQSSRRGRIQMLGRAIVTLAAAHGVELVVLPFREIRAFFAGAGVTTRWEIAATIARNFPQIGHRLPRRRKVWESQDWRIALFSAVALVLVSFQVAAHSLLAEL